MGIWDKCNVPEVLLHLSALILVPLVQKPQDALLKRLSALILRKLQEEKKGKQQARFTEKQVCANKETITCMLTTASHLCINMSYLLWNAVIKWRHCWGFITCLLTSNSSRRIITLSFHTIGSLKAPKSLLVKCGWQRTGVFHFCRIHNLVILLWQLMGVKKQLYLQQKCISYLKKEVFQFQVGFGHTGRRRVWPLHLKHKRTTSITTFVFGEKADKNNVN